MDTVPDLLARRSYRALWVIDSLTAGGAEALVAGLAPALRDQAIDLRVCSLKTLGGNPFAADLAALGVPVINLGARNLRDRAAFHRLLALVREDGVDVVHAHLAYAVIWSAAACRLSQRPSLATLHTFPPRVRPWSREGVRQRLLLRLLDRWVDHTIAVSAAVRDAYLATGALRPGRLSVLHNGIDPRPFARAADEQRAASRARLGLSSETRAVIAVAVLRPEKAVDVLLESARQVIERQPAARFLIVGDGPLRGRLERQAARLGLGGQVLWLGFRRDVPELLAAGDLFVLSSRQDALPTSLLEAMAAGLPVVASDVGGIGEIVTPQSGRLVPAGDPRALGEAIVELLAQPRLAAALGQAGRRRVEERFSAASFAAELRALYRDVLRAGPRGAV